MRALVALLWLLLLPGFPGPDAGLALQRPVPGHLIAAFQPGLTPYSAGHRGVDLAAAPGQQVHAAAAGVVSFAGEVAGRPSVAISHGNGLRTTYTPVRATLAEGDRVVAGELIGRLASWPGHCQPSCLHWGLKDDNRYYDPTDYLAAPPIRLLPAGTRPTPRVFLPAARAPGRQPVAGRITSPFGMRRHPITGVVKLHDGTDIAATCGTPVRAPWSGVVSSAGWAGAYGLRVIVADTGGRSGFAHLQHAAVTAGERVQAGQTLGYVGTSGMSTGCHLHWMRWRDGHLVDPMSTLD
ncbi:MAG: hypothetical protein CSA64_01065 [Arachnia propionica]|nr:MAG: hypothetical protein CSA64_01065 [Arachnia propionica]